MSAALCMAIGAVVVSGVALRRALAVDFSLADVSFSVDERMVRYFSARGLSDAYARIAADIAQGKTARQIEAERFFAKGSINDARRIAYGLLEVRDQKGLVELLKREMRL